jgi:broad specificity phosphatase PhoE
VVSDNNWNTISWLEEARSLLDWLDTLDAGPVLLMVRHSERQEDLDVSNTISAELTEFGHKIALEFGKKLPNRWQTSIYHSPHARTVQTAKEIVKGLKENEGSLRECEELNVLLGGRGDIEKIISLAFDIGFDEFYWRWTRDEIPSDTIEPIDDYLQRLTTNVISRFSKAGKDDLHLYVTHDIVIAASKRIYLTPIIDDTILVPFLGGYGIAKINGELVGFNSGSPVDVTRNLFT